METNTGWQAADARRPSPFRLCWSVRLILASVRQPAAVLPSDTLPSVYTSHARSSQSRRQEFAQSHLLEISPVFHLPCETIRLLFFFIIIIIPLFIQFHSTRRLSYFPAWLATKQLFMIVISIRASYSHYLHYHPPLIACSRSHRSVLPSRCAPDFPEGCQDCHALRLSPFINKPSCCRVSSSP